ncbi:MAG: DNA recombination protein RmuC [Thermodesulfobacteriota bacterium]
MPTIVETVLLAAVALVLFLLLFIMMKIRLLAARDLEKTLREELRLAREDGEKQGRGLREEVASVQARANEVLVRTIDTLGQHQKDTMDRLILATREAAAATRAEIEKLTEGAKSELREIRSGTETKLEAMRAVTEERFDKVRQAVDEKLRQVMEDQRRHLSDVIAALKGLETVQHQEQQKAREILDQQFRRIQESNEKKLEEMRRTVDEKLHDTLEKRIGESFKLVSERLEAVQRGLGEMHTLATGVGDLKRLLGNVKERGTWGEYQLGAILSEILTSDQYERNVHTREGRESVEFAIKLPGRERDQGRPVWLPIDSKFPREAYERLVEASRIADAGGVEAASAELRRAVTRMARDIQEKYINPPRTTDFGILFLPTEGLYAEILRQTGLHDELQQKYRVLAAGPTTLSAVLNSLRVGFQTLAIEKRAGEVWTVLGAVKTEFAKFGDVLEKMKKQIHTMANTLDDSSRRTRAMERRLRDVEQLPTDQARAVLSLTHSEIDAANNLDETETGGNG